MPPLGVSANADGTDNVLRQLEPRATTASRSLASTVCACSRRCERTWLHRVESRCCVLKLQEACQKPCTQKMLLISNSSTQKAAAQAARIGRSAAYFMSDSLTNRAVHKKRSVAYL